MYKLKTRGTNKGIRRTCIKQHLLLGVEEVQNVCLVQDAGGCLQFPDQLLNVGVGHGGHFLATSLSDIC